MSKQTFTTGQVLTASQMTSLQQTAMGGGSTTAKVASYVLVAADAGTVVQMNSASATTITVNTALFAAGDSVQIQNVGSGVCTVTAGTATVSTSATLALKQYDAGTLYFNTTSAAFFFAVDAADTPLTTTGDIIYSSSGSTAARLGIGSSAQVLTVASGLPSWATPASGGMTLLSTTTLSGASTTISSISGSYNRLFVFVSGVTNATGDGTLKIVPNASSGQFYINQINNGSLSGSTNADLVSATMDRTNGLNSFSITFDRYASSLYFVPFSFYGAGYRAAASPYSHSAGAWYSSGVSITSLVFSNTGGNLSGGTVLVYGVN